MGLWVKYLLCKKEDLGSDTQHICKRLGKVLSVAVVLGEDGETWGVSEPIG